MTAHIESFPPSVHDEFPEMASRLASREPPMPKKYNERVCPDSFLFPIEQDKIDTLLELCQEYMPTDSIDYIARAIDFSLGAHTDQYRKTGHPYSVHPLDVAIEAARKEMDDVSICAGLSHDIKEDTEYGIQDVVTHIFGDHGKKSNATANTVNNLTVLRSRQLRKEESELINTLTITEAVVRNPRSTILKIFDRLKNLNTLEGITKRSKRLRTIRESNIHRQLAYILGMQVEAREISRLMVYWRSRKHRGLVRNVSRLKEKMDKNNICSDIENDLRHALNSDQCVINLDYSDDYEIAQRMGTIRVPNQEDIEIKASIQLINASGEDWGREATSIMSQLGWSEKFTLDRPIDVEQIKDDVRSHRLSSLSVGLQCKNSDTSVSVHLLPKDIFEHQNASLTDLYYHKDWLSFIQENGFENRREHVPPKVKRAYLKYIYLQDQYSSYLLAQQESDDYDPINGNNNPHHLLTVFESTIKNNHIRVIGIDKKGEHTPWDIRRGATVLDYAKDTFPSNWFTIVGVRVNARVAPYGYVLKPGDSVKLTFGEKDAPQWDPMWLHDFGIDEQGRNTTRKKIATTIKRQESYVGAISEMRERVAQTGMQLIDDAFNEYGVKRNIPLSIALEFFNKDSLSIENVSELLHKIGIGEVSFDTVVNVVELLLPENNRTGVIDIYFETDRQGILKAVMNAIGLIKDKEISPTRVFAEALDPNEPAHVSLYFDEANMKIASEIVDAISGNSECIELGLLANSIRVNI